MIRIGKTYLTRETGATRICADITNGADSFTLWFSLDSSQEAYLCPDRADAFIIALLPTAMRNHLDIICDGVISEQLYHQLSSYLIPALASVKASFRQVQITASVTSDICTCSDAVGMDVSCAITPPREWKDISTATNILLLILQCSTPVFLKAEMLFWKAVKKPVVLLKTTIYRPFF